jgi:hypothetical protein
MARNQHRRAQEALFSHDPSTIPPEEEKAAERTETPETDVPAAVPAAPSPADYIARTYGIEPNCTNVPRLLYAILCEVVRGRK